MNAQEALAPNKLVAEQLVSIMNQMLCQEGKTKPISEIVTVSKDGTNKRTVMGFIPKTFTPNYSHEGKPVPAYEGALETEFITKVATGIVEPVVSNETVLFVDQIVSFKL